MTDYFFSLFKHLAAIISQQYSFKCFMAFYCSTTLNLGSLFTLFACSLSYFGLPFFIVFLLISLIYTYFFIVYSFFLTAIYWWCFFNLTFWGAFPRDGFTCFIYAIVYFLFVAEHFVTKISLELSVPLLYKFLYTHLSMPMFGYMTQTFFHRGSCSCDFLNFIWIIYVWFNFKCYVILLLFNI